MEIPRAKATFLMSGRMNLIEGGKFYEGLLEGWQIRRDRSLYPSHFSDIGRLAPFCLLEYRPQPGDCGIGAGVYRSPVCVRGSARIWPRTDGAALRHRHPQYYPASHWRRIQS